jgi:hypothetical protein
VLGCILAAAISIGCGGPSLSLRDDLGSGLLGGRNTSPALPQGTVDGSIPPSTFEAWHPPLLANLDSWMPSRPGQLPLQPPLSPPTNSAPLMDWLAGAPAANSGLSSSPGNSGVLPAVFNPDQIQPSNDREWIPEHQLLAWAERKGDDLTVHNVRNCRFYSYRDCIVDHYDKTYRLSDLRSVDFVVVPFNEAQALAHTMLSFGFEGGDYLGISVEVRLEKGESYHPATGLLRQFEIIYVVADERDLIRVRTEHRDCEVFSYRSVATPQQAQTLLVDMLSRTNQLYDKPEFYDTLSNNCTTNIVRHINRLAPDRVPYDYRVLFPGFADQLAYELGLLDNRIPFAELKRKSKVNDLALRYKDSPQFSAQIRGETVQR